MDKNIQLRRDMRGVCLSVGGFILLMGAVSVAVLFVAVLFELATDGAIVEIILKHPTNWIDYVNYDELLQRITYSMQDYTGIASLIGIILGIPIFFLIRGKKFVTTDITTKNSTPDAGTIIMLFILILGIQFVMSLIQIVLEPLFNAGGSSLTENMEQGTTQLATSFWGIIYIVLVGPICEELVFRGAVLRKLEKYGANFAIITSSLLFGLYHVILFQAVFAFFIGLILAYTAGRFSIKWAMLLHILNNSLAVLQIYLNNETVNMVLGLVYVAACVMSIVIMNMNRDLLRGQRVAGAPVLANTYASAYTSPWLIVYIVLCVFGGVSMLGII